MFGIVRYERENALINGPTSFRNVDKYILAYYMYPVNDSLNLFNPAEGVHLKYE